MNEVAVRFVNIPEVKEDRPKKSVITAKTEEQLKKARRTMSSHPSKYVIKHRIPNDSAKAELEARELHTLEECPESLLQPEEIKRKRQLERNIKRRKGA